MTLRGNRRIVILIILLTSTALLSCNTSANVTVNTTDHYYFSEESAIPVELWWVLIWCGLIFLITSLIFTDWIIITSTVAMTFFSAAAFAAPLVGSFAYEVVTGVNATTNETIAYIAPSVVLLNEPWVAWVMWAMALFAFVNVWRGVLLKLVGINESE